jgi:hypothetical protein
MRDRCSLLSFQKFGAEEETARNQPKGIASLRCVAADQRQTRPNGETLLRTPRHVHEREPTARRLKRRGPSDDGKNGNLFVLHKGIRFAMTKL